MARRIDGKDALSSYYESLSEAERSRIKTVGMMMWETRDRAEALATFKGWYSWAIRSRLEPMKRVARMVKAHLDGVLNAIERGVTNARLEETPSTRAIVTT